MRICFDIDGVLTPDVKGEGGPEAYYERAPFEDAVFNLKRLVAEGHTVILMTARGCKSFGSPEKAREFHEPRLRQWLQKWDIPFAEIHWKPIADIYVDDKAFRLLGKHPFQWFHFQDLIAIETRGSPREE